VDRRNLPFVFSFILIIFFVCSVWAQTKGTSGSGWQIRQAEIRFRLEKDDSYAQLPDVFLSGLKWEPKNTTRGIKVRELGSRQNFTLNGRLYTDAITTSGSASIVYPLRPDYERFVSLVGIDTHSSSRNQVGFEVYADDLLLSKTEMMTRDTQRVEINTAIPAGSKYLKLVTKTYKRSGRLEAGWVNAGFVQRGKHPELGFVRLWVPEVDPSEYNVMVVGGGSKKVNSRVVWAQVGEPMDIMFDCSRAWRTYNVYLVKRNKRAAEAYKWEPKAGLILETRLANTTYPKDDKVEGYLQLWYDQSKPIGRALVDNIHFGLPIHLLGEIQDLPPVKIQGLALYYFKGFFRVEKGGEYVFSTASNWSSFLSVDDKLVVGWPGRHGYHGGIRGQKQGKVGLRPGIHKIEYLNGSPLGEMFCLAAMQKPGDILRPMTRSDFVGVSRYKATRVGRKPPAPNLGGMTWRVTGDLRRDTIGAALPVMEFGILPSERNSNYKYRWTFDDGEIKEGEKVEHYFLRPGLRQVTLEFVQGGKVAGKVVQSVRARAQWEEVFSGTKNLDRFARAIEAKEFRRLPVEDLSYLYYFADVVKQPRWKQKALLELSDRLDSLIDTPGQADYVFLLGEDLRSANNREYEKALRFFERLGENSLVSSRIRQQAGVAQVELQVHCFGKAKEGLELIPKVRQVRKPEPEDACRLMLLEADAHIASGQVERAKDLLRGISKSELKSQGAMNEVKHTGLLRHARQLAEDKDDLQQLEYALEEIEKILAEDPLKTFWPNLNLVKLEVHLARQEYPMAFYLCERLEQMELAEQYQPEVLLRKVQALAGMGDLERAKKTYETLKHEYPYSPVIAEARKAILDMAGKTK